MDQNGEPIEPGEAGRATTCVEHDGDVIAVLDHVPALTHEADLLASTIAASRLALENARLTTLVQAQLIDIATSRRHLVDAGLRERRLIERDLHDGAQQRLLAVALGLAVAQRSADRNGDQQMASLLNTLGIDLEHAIDELRDLARGLYPTVLTDRGLPAAVDALAQCAPLPLDVDLTLPRLDSGVEATAYFVIVEALANTIRHAAASAVRITGRLAENHLTIAVIDDGRGGAVIDPARGGSGLRGLDDRARALGGRVTVRSPTAAGTTVTLELPVDAQP